MSRAAVAVVVLLAIAALAGCGSSVFLGSLPSNDLSGPPGDFAPPADGFLGDGFVFDSFPFDFAPDFGLDGGVPIDLAQ